MSKRIKDWMKAMMVSLPLAFVLIFFGFLPPRFDVVIYTDNIVGEGTCNSYWTDSQTTFSYLYKGKAYFGSELKTLRMRSLLYTAGNVQLYLYDVDEVDFVSFDICVFGRTVSHLNQQGLTHPFTPTVSEAVTSEEEPLVHLVKTEDMDKLSIMFPGSELIPTGVWVAYGCFIFLIAALLAALIAAVTERVPRLRLPLLSAASVAAAMLLGCWLCGSLPYVSYTHFLLNWLLLFAAALLVNALTVPWLGAALVSTFTLFWYAANFYVISFRNKPIMPADLKAMGTAKEVLGGYDLTPSWVLILGVAVLLCYLVALVLAHRERKAEGADVPLKKRLTRRACTLAAAVALVCVGVNNPVFDSLNSFQWDAKVLEGFHREGILLTYIHSAMSAHVPKPEGYSREAVAALLEEYREQPEETAEGVRPTRIIMVMNEAFSDLRTVGLDPAIDVMPYIDSLQENTTEGSLYVSIYGGGTCNTEFEALTGNTLAFLGSGAYPYTENVTKPLFSLADYFSNQGYFTESFHANKSTNWNRCTVYPLLGFEESRFVDDYPELNYVHDYVTDLSDYRYMIAEDEAHGDTPRFLFDVTIQNHSSYDHFLDLPEADTVKENGAELPLSARVYLSLVKLSDDAVRELVETYRDSDEPTMIVFFGDHQPNFNDDTKAQVYTAISSEIDYYKSKFFIWTNYETEHEQDMTISANYLPWLILEKGNFPLPPYVRLLRDVHEQYPVLTSQGVFSLRDQTIYSNVEEVLDDPLVRNYQYVQYANLFDELDPAWFEP